MSPPTCNQLFVAIDASTTSLRCVVFDTAGNALATGRSSLSYQRVEADGYEQDANSWWTALCEASRSALAELAPERHKDLCALAIAHQRETVVPTDAQGEPLSQALLWMDNRCREDVAFAERNVGAVRLHAVSGKPACTTPSIYKLMYLFRKHPELRDVAAIHDVHSFLSKKLTGRAVSSFASADPSGLVDMRKKAWSRSMTRLVGVDPHQLPELVDVGYLIGPLTVQAAEQTGLPDHVMVYAGSGDAQLAGLGAGVTSHGKGFLDLGTAIASGSVSDRYEIDTAYRTLHYSIPGKYCFETTLRGGMLTLWWLIEGLLGSKTRNQTMKSLENQARHIPPGSCGLVTIPYWSGVMSPYWDDGVRGSFLGLHPGHQAAHMYRSILEGLALEQRLHLEGVRKSLGKSTDDQLIVIGGGSRSDLWCQIFADVLGRSLHRSRTPDAAALGAAMLCAVAHGVHPSFERAAQEMSQLGARFEPGANARIYDTIYRDVYRGLYRDLQTRMSALAAVREATEPAQLASFPPPASDPALRR